MLTYGCWKAYLICIIVLHKPHATSSQEISLYYSSTKLACDFVAAAVWALPALKFVVIIDTIPCKFNLWFLIRLEVAEAEKYTSLRL